MQSLLFITEEAAAYERLGKLNMALKRYAAVQRVFDIFEDDQYDFHSYSFRRFNLNVYMEYVVHLSFRVVLPDNYLASMMAWEDKLRSHPAYIAAAVGACRVRECSVLHIHLLNHDSDTHPLARRFYISSLCHRRYPSHLIPTQQQLKRPQMPHLIRNCRKRKRRRRPRQRPKTPRKVSRVLILSAP
jgi:hypothetical protein